MEAGLGGTGELGSMQTQKEQSLMRLRVQVKQSRQLVFSRPHLWGHCPRPPLGTFPKSPQSLRHHSDLLRLVLQLQEDGGGCYVQLPL